MLTRSGCEPEPTSERYSPPRTPVLAATASRGAISDHMTMAISLLPRTPSRTFAWWGRRLAGICARSGRATPALRGRAGHAQHVRAHQVIRAARSLGGRKSSVRVSFTFKLRPQTAASRRGSGAAVVRVPPSLRRSYARHEDPVRRTPGVSRRASAGRPIVHDRLHHDLACAEPAPRKGAGVAPVSQGQAQNRRRYCHGGARDSDSDASQNRHRLRSDIVDQLDTAARRRPCTGESEALVVSPRFCCTPSRWPS